MAHQKLGGRRVLLGGSVHAVNRRHAETQRSVEGICGGVIGVHVQVDGAQRLAVLILSACQVCQRAQGEGSAQAASLRRHLEEADLLVACEPDLSFPALAESCLDAITAAAAPWAIPVVALAARSTLSAHERAQWGLHGVFATDGALGPGAAGARIARTWLPAADGPDSAAGRKRVG